LTLIIRRKKTNKQTNKQFPFLAISDTKKRELERKEGRRARRERVSEAAAAAKGRKKEERKEGRRRACYSVDKSRTQEPASVQFQFSFSSVQNERTNRAVAKFGRGEA
jgi:hypothetical protein